MAKTLCDWTSKDIKKHFEELSLLVAKPHFVCRKCARCAESSKLLCEPKKRHLSKKD
jgi:hypothetical protein